MADDIFADPVTEGGISANSIRDKIGTRGNDVITDDKKNSNETHNSTTGPKSNKEGTKNTSSSLTTEMTRDSDGAPKFQVGTSTFVPSNSGPSASGSPKKSGTGHRAKSRTGSKRLPLQGKGGLSSNVSKSNRSISSEVASAAGELSNEPEAQQHLGDDRIPVDILDKSVVSAVSEIQAMLQTYGPLTIDQLRYNLPTKVDPPEKLQHVLDILVALGILSVVDEEKTRQNLEKLSHGESIPFSFDFSSDKESNDKEKRNKKAGVVKDGSGSKGPTVVAKAQAKKEKEKPKQKGETEHSTVIKRYVYLDGKPQFDNMQIFPNRLLGLIELSQKEIDEMTDRIKLLRHQLIRPAPVRRQTLHDFFESTLLEKYPYLSKDPLYAAALDNLKKAKTKMISDQKTKTDEKAPKAISAAATADPVSPRRDKKGRVIL